MWWFGECRSKARLDGKTAIITGCNTGIGKYNVLDFSRRGCRVIMACRTIAKAEEARKEVMKQLEGEQNTGEIIVRQLDLSSLQSIRTFAELILNEEPEINLLVNNAGVMMCPLSRTVDGFELQIGTNHLGHFLLTMLLLPRIIKSAPSKIINVSSVAHYLGNMKFSDLNWEKSSYSPIAAYGRSKLANVLFTRELAKRLKDKGIHNVNVYALHPGVVKTELIRHLDSSFFTGLHKLFSTFSSPFTKSPAQGAQTQIYCAVDEKAAEETGLYYEDCKAVSPSGKARNDEHAVRLWEESCSLVGLGDADSFTPK